MGIQVTVKRRIVFNGKTYDSPEELPEGIRDAVARAMADPASGAPVCTAKVAFNGTEYDGLDAMPPEVRALYERALGAVESGRLGATPGRPTAGVAAEVSGAPISATVSPAPIEPGSGRARSLRTALVAALALALLLLGYDLSTSVAR